MARNRTRKNNSGKSIKSSNSANSSSRNKTKLTDILYQVSSVRTSDTIKAYITFNYRVFNPRVTPRLLFYGLIVLLPGIFYFKDLFWRIFFIAIGVALILLGLFRQYISLWITKRNDADYKNRSEFTYSFAEKGAEFAKNGDVFSSIDRYKDITNFYYDDDFFYLAIKSRELFVLPKKAFTIGDTEGFEDFIYKKSRQTCKWLPNKLSDRIKKRRAERAVNAEKMAK